MPKCVNFWEGIVAWDKRYIPGIFFNYFHLDKKDNHSFLGDLHQRKLVITGDWCNPDRVYTAATARYVTKGHCFV